MVLSKASRDGVCRKAIEMEKLRKRRKMKMNEKEKKIIEEVRKVRGAWNEWWSKLHKEELLELMPFV